MEELDFIFEDEDVICYFLWLIKKFFVLEEKVHYMPADSTYVTLYNVEDKNNEK